ncbi:MAG: vWA domain-containing protein [Syntrophobacteraceae bacterium]
MTETSHEVIDRFHLSGAAGYSEYWRRNKSPVEIYELARLLLGLRKVVSYIGRNVGTVVWSGMKAKDPLVLDPAMIIGSYPVPPEKMDRITGFTVRLAYSKTEWSQRIKDIGRVHMRLNPVLSGKLQFYFEICERVYLDCLSNRSPLGAYTEVHRLWAIDEALKNAANPPTISELMHLWWKTAADRSGDGHQTEYVDHAFRSPPICVNREDHYNEPLALLNSMVDDLKNECPLLPTVTQRCDRRLTLYLDVWHDLLEYIKDWPIKSKTPDDQEGQASREDEPDLMDDESEYVLVLPELLEKATRTIPVFTEDVQRAVGNPEAVVAIEGNDVVMSARDRVDKRMMHHLCMIIRTVAQRRAEVSRGLKAGKIDRRRLYRANITGTIFKQTKTNFELRNDMVVLVDSSGSMSAVQHWENVETVYQTLFAAIHAFNPQARLLSYNEIKEKCLVTETYRKGRFYNVLRHGKTASGEAIISTALSLKKTHRRPYILHITDGASNWGCGVTDAINFCRERGINLLTLGIGCGEGARKSLTNEYGRLVQFIDRIDALPHLLRDLLIYSQRS